MRTEITVEPAVEPVTLEEAKLHCRIDEDVEDENAFLTALITTARRFAEQYCNIKFINTTLKRSYDFHDWSCYQDALILPYGKVQSISSIKTYDLDNQAITYTTDAYRLSGNRVVLNDGYDWPTIYRIHDAVEVNYVVGFGGTADNVPNEIKKAILMMVAHLYENREALTDPFGGNATQEMTPLGFNALLFQYRVFEI